MTDPINVDALNTLPEKSFPFGVDADILAQQLETLAAGLRDGSIVKRNVSHTIEAGHDEFTFRAVTIGYFVKS